VTTAQFGNFKLFTVSGTAYLDINADGKQDPNENGFGGFVVRLTSGATTVQATTASDGSYTFPNLGPGTYTLTELPRRGFTLTQGDKGYTFGGQSGTDQPGLNFGNQRRSVTVTTLDAGGPPVVTVRDAATNGIVRSFNAYAGGFFGGVRVAVGYFNGDTVPDIVTGPGPGGGPDVKVFDGATGALIREFMAYNPGFTGGLFMAAGDVNGDGTDDIITGADAGGGPHVQVFDGKTGAVLRSFMAYNIGFRGGVRVAAGDVNGDGKADIITGAGPGGGPQASVFDGATGKLLQGFFAYDTGFRGGIYVAAGDLNADGLADVITGPGSGGGPHVKAFDGRTGAVLQSFQAFPTFVGSPWTSGARVASYDVNLDGIDDLIVSPGTGQSPKARVLNGATLDPIFGDFIAAPDPAFLGGIFVGGR
jgi:hypothetical protein